MLTSLYSLCARVLKAKYYTKGSLKDTVFASNVSSTWHAIHHGLDLLKKGLIWSIGSGQASEGIEGPVVVPTAFLSCRHQPCKLQASLGRGAGQQARTLEQGAPPWPFIPIDVE